MTPARRYHFHTWPTKSCEREQRISIQTCGQFCRIRPVCKLFNAITKFFFHFKSCATCIRIYVSTYLSSQPPTTTQGLSSPTVLSSIMISWLWSFLLGTSGSGAFCWRPLDPERGLFWIRPNCIVQYSWEQNTSCNADLATSFPSSLEGSIGAVDF